MRRFWSSEMPGRWLGIFLLSISLLALTVFLARAYQSTFQYYLEHRSQALALEVGENLRLLVDSHVRVLQTVADAERPYFTKNSKPNLVMAESLIRHYPGFFAVNWIDDKGVIRSVYPYEQNKQALGKSVFDRVQLYDIVKESREKNMPAITARVPTFQGFEASVMYIPVVRNGEFLGWVNGVLDLNNWLSTYLQSRNQEGLFVRLTWSSNPRVPYEFGDVHNPPKLSKTEVRILNQLIGIEVGFSQPIQMEQQRLLEKLGIAFGVTLVLLVAALLISLQYSLRQNQLIAHRLWLKSVLVSSLTHDLGTPLTVLNMCVDRLEPQNPENRGTWQRMKRAAENLRRMLDSVRLLHSVESGRTKLEIKDVELDQAVGDAVEQMRELSEKKNVLVHVDPIDPKIRVRADEPTLVLNVLPNVLSNAIKFSKSGGQVLVSTERVGKEIFLNVTDQGIGMSPEKLEEIFDKGPIKTGVGTQGETGTGLGLLQVKTFMQTYGGRVEAHSLLAVGNQSKSGTVIRLVFCATEEKNEERV